MTPEELAAVRQDLQDLVLEHLDSVKAFQVGDSPSFNVRWHASGNPTPPSSSGAVVHLTTSATCLESLVHLSESSETFEVDGLLARFASGALDRDDWRSGGSATTYCRCRALPTVLRGLKQPDKRVLAHVKAILSQLAEPDRHGIGEADDGAPKDKWYRAHPYHTYWTLRLLDGLQDQFPTIYAELETSSTDLAAKKAVMLLWSKEELASQVAFHATGSERRDSDRLAWSLATCVLRIATDHNRDTELELVRLGLTQLFAQPLPWPRGEMLFHYAESGNAYCYLFESVNAVLEAGQSERVSESDRRAFRVMLREHARSLSTLVAYARTSRVRLDESRKIYGWRSGNDARLPTAEGWATASAFECLQRLRALFGVWASQAALHSLPIRGRGKDDDPLRTLSIRADSWAVGPRPSALGHRLVARFVNPILAVGSTSRVDPDVLPIAKNQARGCILFGPPGTSKTTIVRMIAQAIGWQYVELQASDFVGAGLPNVYARTDQIFRALQQLDRTVVFFDEFDGLVQKRAAGTDTMERFLTTSMLPKLSELWDARKALYFVATNHLDSFDPAITRSGRFDALVFVAPPSYDRKVGYLRDAMVSQKEKGFLNGLSGALSGDVIQESIKTVAANAKQAPDGASSQSVDGIDLAKFALLRWDQLAELTQRLRKHLGPMNEDAVAQGDNARDVLTRALHDMHDGRLEIAQSYLEFFQDGERERVDYGMPGWWKISGVERTDVARHIRTGDGWGFSDESGEWFVFGDQVPPPDILDGYSLVLGDRLGSLVAKRRQ